MNFEPTEERRMLADSLNRFISEQYGFAARQTIVRSEPGFSPALWQQFAELGVMAALFREADGGFGGDGFDIANVFEALGRGLVVEPLLGSAVLAGDANGAMYGSLDIAEAIKLGALDNIKNCDKTPFIENRGIKFNIPLDLRTPTYSDQNDASQQNIPEMWNMDFWKEFLDEMARNRYNLISLWSLHPFPSIVKVPEFPDVALNDV